MRSVSVLARTWREGHSSALAFLLAAAAACDSSAPEVPLTVTITAPVPASVHYTAPLVTGDVAGSPNPVVTYAVGTGAYQPATMVAGSQTRFAITLTNLPSGSVTVTVRATDGARQGEDSRTIQFAPVTLTLSSPQAADTVHGRVVGFSGQVSNPNALVQYTVGAGPDNDVQGYPPNPTTGSSLYEAEASSLPNGTAWIFVRARIAGAIVARDSFRVNVDVPDRHYTAVVVEGPGSVDTKGLFLANDGRIAGQWWTSPDTMRVFTWKGGTFTALDSMKRIYGVNNVGQVLGSTGSSQTLVWAADAYQLISGFAGAVDINDAGHLVRPLTAGYWDGAQVVAYTAPPTTGPLLVASINNSDQLAGGRINSTMTYTPVAWTSQSTWFVPPLPSHPWLPGYRSNAAFRIGDGGHVLISTVFFPLLGQLPAFLGPRSLYSFNGQAIDLNATVGFGAVASAVNASGVVAGHYMYSGVARGFTWTNGRTTDVVLDTPGWAIDAVWGINDSGQLSARGRNLASEKLVTLLMTPVP